MEGSKKRPGKEKGRLVKRSRKTPEGPGILELLDANSAERVLVALLTECPCMIPVVRSVCRFFRHVANLPSIIALRRDHRPFGLAELASRTGNLRLLRWCERNDFPIFHLRGMELGLNRPGDDATHAWHWRRIKDDFQAIDKGVYRLNDCALPRDVLQDAEKSAEQALVAAALVGGKKRVKGVIDKERFFRLAEDAYDDAFNFLGTTPEPEEEPRHETLRRMLGVAEREALDFDHHFLYGVEASHLDVPFRALLLDVFERLASDENKVSLFKESLSHYTGSDYETARTVHDWVRGLGVKPGLRLAVQSGAILEECFEREAREELLPAYVASLHGGVKNKPSIAKMFLLKSVLESPFKDRIADVVCGWPELSEPPSAEKKLMDLKNLFVDADNKLELYACRRMYPDVFESEGEVRLPSGFDKNPLETMAFRSSSETGFFLSFYRLRFYSGCEPLSFDAGAFLNNYSNERRVHKVPENVLTAVVRLAIEQTKFMPDASGRKARLWDLFNRVGLSFDGPLYEAFVDALGTEPDEVSVVNAMLMQPKAQNIRAISRTSDTTGSGLSTLVCKLRCGLESSTVESFRFLRRKEFGLADLNRALCWSNVSRPENLYLCLRKTLAPSGESHDDKSLLGILRTTSQGTVCDSGRTVKQTLTVEGDRKRFEMLDVCLAKLGRWVPNSD